MKLRREEVRRYYYPYVLLHIITPYDRSKISQTQADYTSVTRIIRYALCSVLLLRAGKQQHQPANPTKGKKKEDRKTTTTKKGPHAIIMKMSPSTQASVFSFRLSPSSLPSPRHHHHHHCHRHSPSSYTSSTSTLSTSSSPSRTMPHSLHRRTVVYSPLELCIV